MVLSLREIFVFVSMLIACVNSQAESGGDPQRLATNILTTSTDDDQGGCLSISCNCTRIQAELEQLRTEVSNQGTTVSSDLEDAKQQLKQVFKAVQNIGVFVKKYTDDITLEDCSKAPANGVYTIQPDGDDPLSMKVYCDMETDGGGWTVFQRRQDGLIDFYRGFTEYSEGFGYLLAEFWLGNENLHLLTNNEQRAYELRVDLTDFEGNSAFAVYDNFRVGDLADNYKLTVEGYSGTAGDSLSEQNGMPFSTKDRDNDNTYTNCATNRHGAWWYDKCSASNLNGKYLGSGFGPTGVVWLSWKPKYFSMKTTEMKLRMKG